MSPIKPPVSQTTTTRTSISTDNTQESLLDLGKEATSSPLKLDRSTPPSYPVPKGSKRNTSFPQHEHKQFISPVKPHVSQTTTTRTSISTDKTQESLLDLGKEAISSPPKVDRSTPPPYPVLKGSKRNTSFPQHEHKQFISPLKPHVSQTTTTHTSISTNTAQERSTQLGKEAAPSKLKPPLPTSMQDQCQKSPPFTKHQSKQFKPPIHSSISQKNTTATHIYSPQDETEEKTLKLESTTGKGENPPLLSLSKAYNKRLLHPSNLEESKKQAPFIKPNQAHNISSVTSSFSQTTAAQPTDHPLTTLAIPQEHLKEERQPSLIPFKEVVARLEKLLSLSIDTELSQNEVAIFIFESLQNYIENSILTEQFIHEAYACLFHSELALHAQEFLNENRSFIKPHPAYVIFSLADCFKALSQEDNFLTIITKAKNYFKSKVEDLLIAHQNQPSVSDYLKKETNAVFIKSVNECPLYTATQWFGTENLNPVFILRTQNFQPEWVFKPTTLDEKSNLSDIRDCEHYAFKMNFHEKFPIPAVFLIQFRGVSGTIQPFIPDTVQFKDIPKDKRILILPALRKLLIFDLLFINHDRNPSNILYRKEGDSYTCYGIDHEHSFQYVGGAATMTQIGLIQKLSQSLHFEDFIDTIQDICSKECCEQYQKRLGECFNHENRLDQHKQDFTNTELENKMLDWIQDVGSKLREAQQNFSEVVNNIKQEMQIIKIAKETSDFQSDQSYLND